MEIGLKIELPYMDLREVTELDPKYIVSHDIKPKDEDKRLRVFAGQLLNNIVEETTLSNFEFNIDFYFRQRLNLQQKFPHRKPDLIQCTYAFWEKMQQKFKQLKREEQCNKNQTRLSSF